MAHIAPWFPDAKFGVFVHWVLRSAVDPARWREATEGGAWRAERLEMAKLFTAEKFDARAMARQFRAWGAHYAVLTTVHEGFFYLYDAPESEFNVVRHGCGRDLTAEFVEGMRAEGLKVGLYYNHCDGNDPDFADGGRDPTRWARYVARSHARVRHLCTAYGKIDLLWFDADWGHSAEEWDTPGMVAMIENLQPGIVLNNRLRHGNLGHYATPEQTAPLGPRHDSWELCDTLGSDWWYEKGETLKEVSHLVRIFGDMVSQGGNYLLNLSPLGDGTIAPEQRERFDGLGAWIVRHSEAIYGTRPGLPPGLFNGASTRRKGALYLIAYDRPRDELVVKGLRGRIVRATHLASGTPLRWRTLGGHPGRSGAGWACIALPPALNDEYATVVKVEFENGKLEFETT